MPSIPFGATVDAGLLMWLECLEETENPKQPDPLHQTQFQQLVNQAYNGSLD